MSICAPFAFGITMNHPDTHAHPAPAHAPPHAPPPAHTHDPDTIASLFQHHRPTLRLVASSECGFDLADDALQAAAITAIHAADAYTPGTNFTAWAAAIVRNAARNLRRSESRHARRARAAAPPNPRPDDPAVRPIPNTGLRPDSTPARPIVHLPDHLDTHLRSALDELTPEQRCCLLLRTVLAHDYATIAQIMDIPPATARSHARRARLRLLDILQSQTDPTP